MSDPAPRILFLAEHNGHCFAQHVFRALAAAQQLGEVTWAVLLDPLVHDEQALFKTITSVRVQKVLKLSSPKFSHFLPEPVAEACLQVVQALGPFDAIVAPVGVLGKKMLPRLAALLGVEMVSNVTEIASLHEMVHPIYAGNALERVRISGSPVVLSVRAAYFSAQPVDGKPLVENFKLEEDTLLTPTVFHQLLKSESKRPALNAARVVVSGGRGLQSGENFKLLEPLADVLDAAIGASRAAVDAGFVSNEYQVGQTGQMVSPDLYIAIGISGAIQHVAGMKDSRVIVAINQDPNAPIFEVADYGLVGDLFSIVPELTAALKAKKEKG